MFTEMSSKGQIVVPEAVRKMLNLHAEEMFALFGEEDTIILKRLELPSQGAFERLFRWGHEYAKKKGLKKEDVTTAIEEVRSQRG